MGYDGEQGVCEGNNCLYIEVLSKRIDEVRGFYYVKSLQLQSVLIAVGPFRAAGGTALKHHRQFLKGLALGYWTDPATEGKVVNLSPACL